MEGTIWLRGGFGCGAAKALRITKASVGAYFAVVRNLLHDQNISICHLSEIMRRKTPRVCQSYLNKTQF